MRKLVSLVVVAAFGGLMLAACGGSSNGGTCAKIKQPIGDVQQIVNEVKSNPSSVKSQLTQLQTKLSKSFPNAQEMKTHLTDVLNATKALIASLDGSATERASAAANWQTAVKSLQQACAASPGS